MEQPDRPSLERSRPPPGGLRVRESLDRIEVALPPYLPGRAVELGTAVALGMAGLAAAAAPGGWAPLVLGAGLALEALLLLLWARRGLLAGLERSAQGNVEVLAVMATGGLMVACSGVLMAGTTAFLQMWAAGALGVGILSQLWRAAPRLTVDQAKLEIHEKGRRQVFPLDAIRRVERRGWRAAVRIGGEAVPALAGLSDAEWAWIEGSLEEQIARRRAALIREGHDLAASPPGLAEVLATRGRG